MALNVISNYAANVAQRYLQRSDEAATRAVAKLSAGTRVLSARDDAASMAVATSIRSDIAGLKQAAVNTGQASSMLQIADGAMGTVTDILIRAKTLSVQAASDQLTDNQRAQINVEFQALQDEIDRIAKGTRFDGQSLLNGTGAAGQSSFVSAAVSNGNAVNKGAAYAFQVHENNLRFGNATYGHGTLAHYDGGKVSVTVNGIVYTTTLATGTPTADALATDLQAKLRAISGAGLGAATVTNNNGTFTINSGASDKSITALDIKKSDGTTAIGSETTYARQQFINVAAKVGSTELNFEIATADSFTMSNVVEKLNSDRLFSQYFQASSELVNADASKGRLYLTALTNDPLTAFSIKSRSSSGGAGTAIKGLEAADIKVGQSATYELGGTKVNAKDSFAFKLGGTESTVNMSDVAAWANQVSNVAAASGTADNTVAATKQRVEYDLSGLLTTANDALNVTINGVAGTTKKVAANGDAVATTIDAFIAANASISGATLSREGNKLVLTATTAGTGFVVTTVNAQKAGAIATEVFGTVTQANYSAAAVGVTADGRLVRKNTASVESFNTDVELSTQESLNFIAAYINDSSSPPHTLGQSVIAAVGPTNQLVLTTKGGTLGSQAAFSAGAYASSTGTEAFSATFQIGARNAASERLTVKIANVSAAGLGIDKAAAKVTSVAQALASLDKINAALDRLASARSAIGAQQNRLDFAAENLSVTIENSEAARSNLLDLDVSAEMSFFVSQQILQQAGVSMLAQANQMPQNLLRLFR
jgi:flagellin